MKRYQFFIYFLLIYTISMFFCTCDDAQISFETARLSGKISMVNSMISKDTTMIVRILSPTHFTHGYYTEVSLNDDGTFFVDVPVVCKQICQINFGKYQEWLLLNPGEETKFEVIVDEETEKKQTQMISGLRLTEADKLNNREVFNDIVYPYQLIWVVKELMGREDFNIFVGANLEKIARVINNNSKLSDLAKQYILHYMYLFYLNNYILDLEQRLGDVSHYSPPLQLASDFSFLKQFNLNDSKVIYPDSYVTTFQKLLSEEGLNISPIGDTSVKNWLKDVKTKMTDLIGSDTGLFYELLVANSYSRQLYEETKPLSERQKENIKNYFKNKTYTDLLFIENEKIIKAIEANTQFKRETPQVSTEKLMEAIISNEENTQFKRETPQVSKAKLMEAIVSNYKGKVVIVDFWATWCGPCLSAIKQSKELKSEMQKKNVTFVYITDTSSPKGLWEQQIHEIGGEHYYLTEEENTYLSEQFEFNSIPTYLLYDSNGVFKRKITSYPGNDNMRKMIEDLLP